MPMTSISPWATCNSYSFFKITLRQYFLSEAFPDREFLFFMLYFLYVYTLIIVHIGQYCSYFFIHLSLLVDSELLEGWEMIWPILVHPGPWRRSGTEW